MVTSCGRNENISSTKEPTPAGTNQPGKTTAPTQSTEVTSTPEVEKIVMYDNGNPVSTAKFSYAVKLKSLGPAFGYREIGGGYSYSFSSGQRLLLVNVENVKKEWDTTSLEKAFDIMIKQRVVEGTVNSDMKLGGDTFGKWDRYELETEVVTINNIECMAFDGVIGATMNFAGKPVELERYVAGYVFINQYENGNIPACVIGTVVNGTKGKVSELSEEQKKEVRDNVKIMMESMEISEGDIVFYNED